MNLFTPFGLSLLLHGDIALRLGPALAGFDLLSGHTHGGPFYPWSLFVRFQPPFTAGLHCAGGAHVSRGAGDWGPPQRFGAPSEITRIRRVAA